MGAAVFLIVAMMLAPVALYIRHVAFVVPRRGRAMQERQWQLVAQQLGGRLERATGGARFSQLIVPSASGNVVASVVDRALIDAAIRPHVRMMEYGGWRTFVHAWTAAPGCAFVLEPDARGDGNFQLAGFRVEAKLGTPPAVIAALLTPDVRANLAPLARTVRYVIVGPGVITIEIPGVCDQPAVLDAAIRVATACAASPSRPVASAAGW